MIVYEQLIDSIINGELDDKLDSISNVINQRIKIQRSIKATVLASELNIGDIVKISDTVSPKKLANLRVEIVKLNESTASVKIYDEFDRIVAGKWGYGTFKLPLGLIEKV